MEDVIVSIYTYRPMVSTVICGNCDAPRKSPIVADTEPTGNDSDAFTEVVQSTSDKSISALQPTKLLHSSTMQPIHEILVVVFIIFLRINRCPLHSNCKGTTFFANKQMFIYFLCYL